MSDTITLADLDAELVFEAGLDGANARHVQARRYALINRCYKRLRSLVANCGDEFFRTIGAATATPSRTSGEDFIELVWPKNADEIVGVDIQYQGEWKELRHGSFAQRRVFPGGRGGVIGEWAVLSQPQPSTNTVTAGSIAIWPHNLTGDHKIHFLPKWTPITDGTHVFVLFPDWLEYLLTAATMVLIQRDNNKRDTFLAAKDRNEIAKADILRHARRSKRGVVAMRRRDGMEL
jgi:hypothetical protein